MDWKVLEGKKVFLRTKKNFQYSGIVFEVTDTGDGLVFILLKDKFDKIVGFTSGEIQEIREED
jgi:hypothetical protein